LALDFHKKYTKIKDSLFTAAKDRDFGRQEVAYELNKKMAIDSTTSALKLAKEHAESQRKDIVIDRKKQEQYFMWGIIGIVALFLIILFNRLIEIRKQKKEVERQKKRSDDLLLSILPEKTAEELKNKGAASPQPYDMVSIIFTDFKGFTAISEELTAIELVAELNHYFTAFDEIIGRHNIEKIKTIGDAYMAAGGLPIANTSNAVDTINAALEIRDFMLAYKAECDAKGKTAFEVRIGVHTGPIVAGIVGIKKFSYDIWGDTVNTAARMESSGEVGKVNMSGTTQIFVKDYFACHYRGKIPAKNKGEIDMYFVDYQVK